MECTELANVIDRVLIILWLLGAFALVLFIGIGIGIGKSLRSNQE